MVKQTIFLLRILISFVLVFTGSLPAYTQTNNNDSDQRKFIEDNILSEKLAKSDPLYELLEETDKHTYREIFKDNRVLKKEIILR